MMRLALTTVAVLAVAAAGCGGVENDSNLAKAAERTEEVGSFGIVVTEQGGDGLLCAGNVDVERSRARISCRGGDPGDYESVIVDESMYLRSPEVAPKWSKLPLDEMDEIGQLAPERILEALRSASERTERIGEEDIRGAATVRYAFTVDCERVRVLGCEGETVANAWIDGDGLVRRIRFDDEGSSTYFDFSHFGLPFEIEPPPSDQVVEGGRDVGESGFETGEIETAEVETIPQP